MTLMLVLLASAVVLQAQAQVPNAELIKPGSPGEARTVSIQKKALVLHISGGKGEKYSALQYAQMLQIMFADSTRTKHPVTVSILYEESGEERATGAFAILSGRKYDRNGGEYNPGDGVYHPAELVKDIPKITKAYFDKKPR